MRYGVALEDLDDPLDPELILALGRNGVRFDHCHKFVDLSKINPAPDQWNFTKLDHDVRVIREAGMDLSLRLLWCPRHASEDRPAYLEYAQGCSVVDGNRLRFATERDFCMNPPHIDSDKMFQIGRQFALRYADNVSWWSVWNEPGGDLYWPPVHGGTDVDGAFDRLSVEVIRPAIEGIRSAAPNAVFLGCEAQGGDELQRLLQKCGTLWTYYTVHRYLVPGGSLAEFHNEMNFYATVVRQWGGDAARNRMWLSEAGDGGSGSRLIELAREAAGRYGDVLYGISWYMTPAMATMWFAREADGRYTLNTQGREMQQFISRDPVNLANQSQFNSLLHPMMIEIRNSDLRELLAACTNVGQSTGSIEQEAQRAMEVAKRIDTALAARRSVVDR